MQIFQQEYDDGLSDQIRASASISYASLVDPCSNQGFLSKVKNIKSIASIKDADLYYVQSILVTSSWNKNDDIFDKSEVWLARNTPEDKPTNLEHNENLIIGHIISNWPITEDGILIDENTPLDNLPNKYHILTGSVVYKGFSDPELKSRSEKLISEIESGQKYVSMECFFNGFDYGLVDKSTGEYKILSRNNETAYLTKHLRCYGGLGEHENYKIGRVLRNITFSGKGYVDKPANPDSIIFTKNNLHPKLDNIETEPVAVAEEVIEEKKPDFSFGGVSDNQSILNTEKSIMSDIETVLKDVAEIKNKVESMMDCSQVAKEAYASAAALKDQTVELQNTIASNNSTIDELKTSLETVALEKEEAMKKMKEEYAMKEEEMKKMKAELDATLEVIAAYKDKEAEMMKKEKKMKRMATLIETGLDTELATSTVEKFESLDDASFDSMTEVFATMHNMHDKKKKKMEEEAMMMKKKASEEETQPAIADPSVLETAEVDETDINLSVGGEEESSLESTRAALVEFVESRLGKKL